MSVDEEETLNLNLYEASSFKALVKEVLYMLKNGRGLDR